LFVPRNELVPYFYRFAEWVKVYFYLLREKERGIRDQTFYE
jgi:hypothetical protein